jgi:hypothetical protein
MHMITLMRIRIHLFTRNADPDPNPAFYFNANSNPAPYKREVILRPLVYRPYKAPTLSLHASIYERLRPSTALF